MASNGKHGNQNQLHRSGNGNMTDIRNLGGLQGLGNLVMQNGPNAIPLSSSYLQPPMSSQNLHSCGHPPLPVRRNPISSYGRMGMGMGNYFSPYSRYPTNMYTPGYGGYRMSQYGQYGGGPPDSSSFIQMAEESTRPAFESIESVVEVVSSISMMLESTYHAVHSSYSAILGVVDQFSRLKDHIAQMLSILALLRGLRWLCLKFLYLMKLRKENPSDEAAWNSAQVAAGFAPLPPRSDKTRGSAWPFLMFVGLVIGAPWLMFKLLSKTVTKNPLDSSTFRDEQGRHVMATTAFDFKATQSDELSFSAGEKLYVSPSSSCKCPQGWLYACNSKLQTGLIPCTYLVLNPKNSTRFPRNVPHSFQQMPPQGFPEQGPHQPLQNCDYSRNPAGNFNEAFDYSKNLVENSNTRPTNFDYSKNVGEKFNAQQGYPDCLKDSAKQLNEAFDYSRNAGVPTNTHDYSKDSAATFNSQPGGPDFLKNSAENFNSQLDTRNCSLNSSVKGNAQLGITDQSKNSTEEMKSHPNNKAPEEVVKNQNMKTTET